MSNAWFDVHTFSDRTVGEDDAIPGLKESISYISDLARREVALLNGRGNVVLLGFSQGSALLAMAVLSGELEQGGIGGVVGMSGWLPFRREIAEAVAAHSLAGVNVKRNQAREHIRKLLGLEKEGGAEGAWNDAPLWLGHGKEDAKVLLKWGEKMRDVMSDLEVDIRWNVYEGLAHWWCEEEVGDIAEFFESIFKTGS